MLRDKLGEFSVVKNEVGGERSQQAVVKIRDGKVVRIRGVHKCQLG